MCLGKSRSGGLLSSARRGGGAMNEASPLTMSGDVQFSGTQKYEAPTSVNNVAKQNKTLKKKHLYKTAEEVLVALNALLAHALNSIYIPYEYILTI